MLTLWPQLVLGVSLCLVVLTTTTSALYDGDNNTPMDLYQPDSDAGADLDFVRQTRGIGMRPVPFPCNGHDHLARCLHNGRGPRKTWTKAGRFCVCLCSSKWTGPECSYSADSLRKRYRNPKRSENPYPSSLFLTGE